MVLEVRRVDEGWWDGYGILVVLRDAVSERRALHGSGRGEGLVVIVVVVGVVVVVVISSNACHLG